VVEVAALQGTCDSFLFVCQSVSDKFQLSFGIAGSYIFANG